MYLLRRARTAMGVVSWVLRLPAGRDGDPYHFGLLCNVSNALVWPQARSMKASLEIDVDGGGWRVVQVGDVGWDRCLLASLLIAELPLGGPVSCRLALGWAAEVCTCKANTVWRGSSGRKNMAGGGGLVIGPSSLLAPSRR